MTEPHGPETTNHEADAQAIDHLLRLKRVPRAQIVLEWKGAPRDSDTEALLKRLGEALGRDLPEEAGSLATPPGIKAFLRPGSEDIAQLRHNSLTVMRRFTGSAEADPELTAKWIRNHWTPLFEPFKGPIKPRFVALILDVELSASEILDDASERRLLTRYLRRPPGWEDVVDAEFRISKVVEDRYFLNFGLSLYKTINLKMESAPALLAGPNDKPKVNVQIEQRVIDHGLKVQVDANTKVNILNGRADIEVTSADLTKCLELARNGIERELRPFLRMQP